MGKSSDLVPKRLRCVRAHACIANVLIGDLMRFHPHPPPYPTLPSQSRLLEGVWRTAFAVLAHSERVRYCQDRVMNTEQRSSKCLDSAHDWTERAGRAHSGRRQALTTSPRPLSQAPRRARPPARNLGRRQLSRSVPPQTNVRGFVAGFTVSIPSTAPASS